jgi:hypothetical protein
MAKIFRLDEIQAKKRALVAESEVYRQTLTLEIQNLRLYGVRMQKRFALLRVANPLLILAGSLLGSRFFGKRAVKAPAAAPRRKWSRMVGTALMGWRLFRQFQPLIQELVSRRWRVRRRNGLAAEEESRAPNV